MKISGYFRKLSSSGVRLRQGVGVVVPTIVWNTASSVLSNVDLGQAVNTMLSAAANNQSSVVYSLVSGVLPQGLSLNADTGAITGIPSTSGMFAVTIRATAGRGQADRNFGIVINNTTVTWTTPAALGTINGGDTVAQTLSATASNGGSLTYSIVSGALPEGVILSNGALSGIAQNVDHSGSVTLRAKLNDLVYSDRTFSYALVAGTVVWNTSAGLLDTLKGGRAKNIGLSATSSQGKTVTYSVLSGALPLGLSIAGAKISGTAANQGGTASFVLRATDGVAYSDRTFSLTVNQNTINWTTASDLGSPFGGTGLDARLSAVSTNDETVTYEIVGSSLPMGVTLSGNALSGTLPNLTATYTFVVRAADGIAYADRTFTLTTTLVVVTWNDPGGALETINAGSAFTKNLSAVTNSRRPISYSVVAGSLPDGVGLTSHPIMASLIGTPSGVVLHSYAWTLRASDGIAFADLSFTIDVNPQPLWVTSAGMLANVAQTERFNASLLATAQQSGITYSTDAGFGEDGSLLENVTFKSDVAATSAVVAGYVGSQDPARPVWVAPRGDVGTVRRGTNVTYDLGCRANTQNNRSITGYALVGGTQVPSGLTLTMNGTTGNASVVGLADLYPTDMGEAEVSVTPPPAWTTPPTLVSTSTSAGYTANLAATALAGTSISVYSLIGGTNLPSGLSLNPATGQISGTVDPSTSIDATIPPDIAPTWTTPEGNLVTASNRPTNSVNTTLAATPNYGTSIRTYAVTANALPSGLSLNGATGVISGSIDPSVAQTDKVFPMNDGPVWNTSGSLGSAKNGNAVSITLTAAPPGAASLSRVMALDALPAGLTVTVSNATTGAVALSGTLDANTTTASSSFPTDKTLTFSIRAIANTTAYTDATFSYTILST